MRRQVVQIGDRQGRDQQLVFALHPQDGTAGQQDLELGAGREQFREQRCRCRYLLEVVQQEQEVLVAQDGLQILKLQSLPVLAQSERLRHGEHDLLRSRDRSEWDIAVATGKGLLHIQRDLEGQA